MPFDDFRQTPGNIAGIIHSHRFPAANTALPFVNGDTAQLDATEDFLARPGER